MVNYDYDLGLLLMDWPAICTYYDVVRRHAGAINVERGKLVFMRSGQDSCGQDSFRIAITEKKPGTIVKARHSGFGHPEPVVLADRPLFFRQDALFANNQSPEDYKSFVQDI